MPLRGHLFRTRAAPLDSMFARGRPKVYIKLREGLEAARLFGGLAGATFASMKGLTLAVLSGSAEDDAVTYTSIKERLRAHRAGTVVRITVFAAEAVAVGDFSAGFVLLESLAQSNRFLVKIMASKSAAEYSIGKNGKIISKRESLSALLDSYA